jgi:hypothetical protein
MNLTLQQVHFDSQDLYLLNCFISIYNVKAREHTEMQEFYRCLTLVAKITKVQL